MKKSVGDLVKLALPLNAEKKRTLDLVREYLDEDDCKELTYYLKLDLCFARMQSFGTELVEDVEWPLFKSHREVKEVHDFLERINAHIDESVKRKAYESFAPNALERISAQIAPNIVGLDEAKQAAATQLFASEPIHVLLIGDPGTGKTDILRSLEQMAPIASFGLGSGVSGVGLSAAAKGDDIIKGLLPLAHEGIACIDELNLIKAKDLAALYNAMEKGFISYDKGTTHETLPAKVRVCATANPANTTFVGKTAEVLRKQIPFQDALLSRFHLIYIIRKPTKEQFEQITKKIVSGTKQQIRKEDAQFIKGFVTFAQQIDVKIDARLEAAIVGAISHLKEDERKFIVEVGPRTVVGLLRLTKAIARSELSEQATEGHLDLARRLLSASLYREDHEA